MVVLVLGMEGFAILGQNLTLYTLSGTETGKKHSLSGALLDDESPTLSGTLLENPTLAILAYAYCSQFR